MRLLRIAALFAIASLSGVACSDGDDDDQVSPGTDVNAACDPVRQDCPAGQQCTGGCNVVGVMAKVFTCAVPNAEATATHGQDCGAGCARGHDCFVVPAPGGGTRNVCRKYCNVDADCPTTCGTEGLVCSAVDLSPIGRLCEL